jgi:hypothetical protein
LVKPKKKTKKQIYIYRFWGFFFLALDSLRHLKGGWAELLYEIKPREAKIRAEVYTDVLLVG